MRFPARAWPAALALAFAAAAAADRVRVLEQVDLPHHYYWREMYLPQLTTGPSSLAFMPDGDALVYSMDGSLWRQAVASDTAVQLTHADAAYDYQPDVSPDGASVVFTRHDGRAMELQRLELASGAVQALTANGGVSLEPRISPDGRRIAYVSTAGTGHFNLKVADLGPAGLSNERFLVAPRESAIDRYYYSSHDHAIHPSWSPDGERVWFVGNAEVAWGSGWICSVPASGGNFECSTRHREESTWAARPEVAPDGRRLLYSSYRGRQWHQLALTTTAGEAPIPLSYGDFDRRNARWSPDGRRIAFVSNEGGNTSLWVQDFDGGARSALLPLHRKRLRPTGTVTLAIADGAGRPLAARVSVLGSDRRWHAPRDAWMHGDEAYDRAQFPSEVHYFHCASRCEIELPTGRATIHVQAGFRRRHAETTIEVAPGAAAEVPIRLEDHALPEAFGTHVGADLHVHMNYGGHYRATPATLLAQMEAEDLDVVHNLLVNKEERIPDVAEFGATQRSESGRLLLHAQEYHTSFWGHLGLLHLEDHLLLPDYSSYRHTALASPWPHNGVVAELARAQGGLAGYVHPFDDPVDPATAPRLSYQLPADAAQGRVDYFEVMGFSDHRVTAGVWYRFLNLGFRIPAGAGTDAMSNYASLRGPVGLVRVFLDTGGERSPAALREALKAGRGFVSNGPLLGLEIGGQRPGGEIARAGGPLEYRLALRSPVAIDRLELVQNGRVIESFQLTGDRRSFDAAGKIAVKEGGWILLRAWNERADPRVLDLYPYATTNPVWLGGPAPRAPADARFFLAWMDRMLEAARARDEWNDPQERAATLEYLEAAREKYRALATP